MKRKTSDLNVCLRKLLLLLLLLLLLIYFFTILSHIPHYKIMNTLLISLIA